MPLCDWLAGVSNKSRSSGKRECVWVVGVCVCRSIIRESVCGREVCVCIWEVWVCVCDSPSLVVFQILFLSLLLVLTIYCNTSPFPLLPCMDECLLLSIPFVLSFLQSLISLLSTRPRFISRFLVLSLPLSVFFPRTRKRVSETKALWLLSAAQEACVCVTKGRVVFYLTAPWPRERERNDPEVTQNKHTHSLSTPENSPWRSMWATL